MADWLIVGCGYVGERLARHLLSASHRVRVTSRIPGRLGALAGLGAAVLQLNLPAVDPAALTTLVEGLTAPTVVLSVPPLARPVAAALGGAGRLIYLSSTGVYGRRGGPVDEATPTDAADPDAVARLAEEAAARALGGVALRLAAVYGPGRGVRERLRRGGYRLVGDGERHVSRVHVDDVVGAILAAAAAAPPGAVYCVADDRPTTQREHADWIAARLGQPPPPGGDTASERFIRDRRVGNAKLKRELGLRLRYPTYIEGELAIEAEGAG